MARNRARKVVLVGLIAGAIWGVAGTTAYAEESSSSNAPPASTYSFFYDQGDHLRELIKAGDLEGASRLYAQHRASFFDAKGTKYTADLDGLASKIAEQYNPMFEQALAALSSAEISNNPAAWPAAREALTKASQVLEAFAPHEQLASGSRGLPVQQALAIKLQDTKAEWQALAPEALGNYDTRRNFFADYPIGFEQPGQFLTEVFPRIEPQLRQKGAPAVLAFHQAYAAELAKLAIGVSEGAPVPLPSRLANLYVELLLGASGPGVNRLKSAMTAVTEARKQGMTPTEVPGITIAFVEATSQTLLKEGQIDFPVAIDVDLPFKTVKATLDESLGANSPFEYVLAVEVSMAKSLHRTQKRDQISSQFLTGHRDVPNPEYEPARMAVQQAQYAVASHNAQYCQGYGCLAKGVLGIALAIKQKEASEVFAKTPMTFKEPVYQQYQFNASDLAVRKTVTANYYVIDTGNRSYFKSTFDMGEEKNFTVAYNLHEKDKNLDTYLSKYDKEAAVKAFDEASATVRLSDVLAQFTTKGGESKPFKNLAAVRDEMLTDKNKALVAFRQRERDQSASTQADSRFDSVVVIMNPKGSLGTGFYVEPELVLTNYHVIEGAQFVEMKLRNGLETFGKVVKSDVRLDLALVRVQARGKPVQFHSGAIPLGATVEAIGHPKGLEFSITRGVVSALRRQPSPFGVSGKEVLFVQTDAPINPGNSGGPLFLGNNVVAVNDNKFAGKGIEGIGFSVHYTEVQDFLREGF